MIAASKDHPLAVQGRVLKALILRDVRTRFFGNALGYLVAMGWPLVHMVMLLAIYSVTGRTAPLGDSVFVFFAIGLVPVITFQYMSRWISYSVINNRPLLNFPVVKLMDIILARAILEVACSFCVAGVLAIVLTLMGLSVEPDDSLQAAAAMLSAVLFGLGVGAISAIVCFKLPGFIIVMILVNITLYVTSGVVFLPDALPEPLRVILAWNPLLHPVEWMREAYYPEYRSALLDKSYTAEVGAVCLFIAVASERLFRNFLTR